MSAPTQAPEAVPSSDGATTAPVDDARPGPASPDASADSLVSDLRELLGKAEGKALSINQVLEGLGDRGHAAGILLLTAPFLVNPIPGLSTAFGAAVFILGLCVVFGLKPRLPGFIGRKEISHDKLERLVKGVEWLFKKVGRLIKPRMKWVTGGAGRWLVGVSICFGAVAMALPIPIPFNNVPPAIVVVFLALGLLERDGVATLIGHVLNIVLWALLLIFAHLIWQAIVHMGDKIAGLWDKIF